MSQKHQKKLYLLTPREEPVCMLNNRFYDQAQNSSVHHILAENKISHKVNVLKFGTLVFCRNSLDNSADPDQSDQSLPCLLF